MKTQLTQLQAGSKVCAMTKPGADRRPILASIVLTLWATTFVLSAFDAEAGVVVTGLYSFAVCTNGEGPASGLVQGTDGNFYGTTQNGGTNGGWGTVFKIAANGALTSLYSFTGGNDGAYPQAGLVQGSDGYFYGTTAGGGTNGGWGTVFKITTNGALTSLYSFTGGNDGLSPYTGLVQGSDSNFYGTTGGHGTNDVWGTVFKISTNGALTTLHSFTFSEGVPNGLVQGSDGNFYTTTKTGGTSDFGTVFKIAANGALTSLYSFTGGNDGSSPQVGLVQGTDGNFYGTTAGGGTNGGWGTAFKISANGSLTSLHSFTGYDGAGPNGLVQGSDGNFYGTTSYGGTNNLGTVFKISTDGTMTSLYSFGSNDGRAPNALLQGTDGNFYGTTPSGGANDFGTVFQLSTNGSLTTLYSFDYYYHGAYPEAGLVQGSDGNFYGTTKGLFDTLYSTVFQLSATGALTTLYSFTSSFGVHPSAVVQGSDGNLYGTTQNGGTNGGWGTVFKIAANGALTSLYSFTGGNDGANPQAGLVQGSDGYFYGTTAGGGTNGGWGTVFKITTNGALTSLYSFTGGTDGANPQAGLVQGSDGYFYGTTSSGGTKGYGTVFKISTNGALITLYSFTGGNDGAIPNSGLVQGNDGSLYGTTYGGRYNDGTVFKMSTNGTLTTLYSFTGGNDGAIPNVVVEGNDGSLYGTTSGGGAGGNGTVFRLTIVRAAPAFLAATITNSLLTLTWSTEAGGRYHLEYNSDLSSSNWISLDDAVTASGATTSATDSITNGPRRFYRVVLSP